MKHKRGLLFLIKDALLRVLILAYWHGAFIHRASANAYFNICRRLIYTPIEIWALPLVWMDESTVQDKGLLVQSIKCITYGPHYIDREQTTESRCIPDIYYHLFGKARVSVSSSSVVLNEKLVIIERAIGPDQDKYDYSGGQIMAHRGDTAIVRLGRPENIKQGIFLGGNGSSNYYHWMVEILPKLEFLSKLPEQFQKYPLLVNEDVVNTSSLKETLDMFASGCELVVLGKQSPYVVDELIYINSPSNIPFNLVGSRKAKPSDCTISSHSIDYVRKIALQNALKIPVNPNYPKRIFFGRKSGIRNYNQDEVFNYLSNFGFTKIFLEDISFVEQVRTIHHADLIAGPTGAAWTNLIFCRTGAKGLCWMAEESGDFSAFSSIAGMVGVDLRYVTYSSAVHSTKELYFKDYYIDLDILEKGLSALNVVTVPA